MNGACQRVDAPRVWIVLVNWNGWRDTIECLESVFRLDYPNFRVIVCDNASSDGSLEHIQRWANGCVPYESPPNALSHLSWPPLSKPVQFDLVSDAKNIDRPESEAPLLLVDTGGNLGFAGGNNVGIRLALGDPACSFVWLLNNDTVVETNCLAEMVGTASRDPSIGVTGSVNCFYSRPEVVQALGGGWFSWRRVRAGLHAHNFRRAELTPACIREAELKLDWVSGASMLVSRSFIERVGAMEERYFLYYEEIDWALRSRGVFVNALALSAVLYHKAGSSTGEGNESAFSIYTMYRSRFKLYRKLVPHWLWACYLRSLKELVFALLKVRLVRAKSIFRACRDDLASTPS